MDKKDALEIANYFANSVKGEMDILKIFLFGSYAKGTAHVESDIDIAVVLEDFDSLTDIQLKLMRIRRKIDSRIEPHPFRKIDFEQSNPIVNEILKYGEELV